MFHSHVPLQLLVLKFFFDWNITCQKIPTFSITSAVKSIRLTSRPHNGGGLKLLMSEIQACRRALEHLEARLFPGQEETCMVCEKPDKSSSNSTTWTYKGKHGGFIYQPCMCIVVCVNHTFARFYAPNGIYQDALMPEDVFMFLHTSDHKLLVVEKCNSR